MTQSATNALIREIVERHASIAGALNTQLEGLQLFRVEAPFIEMPGIYSPSVCVLVAGEKTVTFGGSRFTFNETTYACVTTPTPILADVPEASPDVPLLGVLVELESNATSQLVLEMQAAGKPIPLSSEPVKGFGIATRDRRFNIALARFLELLDDPVAAQVLGRGRLRELLFAVLQGEARDRLCADFGAAPALAKTLAYIRMNLSEDLPIDSLAERTHMSRAVFDRKFKAATLLSPLQYIKSLRLNDASMRIARGESIGEAAKAVGYFNSSQFSREFRQKFGKSPREWARETRGEQNS